MLDILESGSSNLTVKNIATMTLMGMLYPVSMNSHYWFQSRSSFIHIGVGFGVARSTVRAMPEPQDVGRVTSRFPRFFIHIANIILTAKFWVSAWLVI